MTLPIPVIEARGSAYEVGCQIGQAARISLTTMYASTRGEYGDKWASLKEAGTPFLHATEKHLPNVLEELRGCADGAGIPFHDLFLMSVEELLYEEVRGESLSNHPTERAKGCTDLAAGPSATRDGHVWLAHNNDLERGALEHLFVTHFCVSGEPEILAVTVGGLFISIGLNNAGIALTGNQLTANDSRIGVPRLLVVRDILAQTNLDDALQVALLPERASSYNNIIASADGRIVNVEGSATAAVVTWSGANADTLAHANHYLAPEMQRFEADEQYVMMSASRCSRALEYAQKYRGCFDFGFGERFLRDHVYAPWSICKHAGTSVTVFGALLDVTAGIMWLTRGNPCQSEFTEYRFAETNPGLPNYN